MAISRRRGGGATPRDLAGGRGNFGLRLPPSGRLRLPAAPALRRFCAYSAACAWGGSPAAASLRLPSPRYARPCGDPRPATGKGRGTRAKKTRSPRRRRLWHCRRRRLLATRAPLRGTRRRRQAARRRRGWGYGGVGSAYGIANALPRRPKTLSPAVQTCKKRVKKLAEIALPRYHRF